MRMRRTGKWKGHCAMCAMQSGKWRRGTNRDCMHVQEFRAFGRRKRVTRNTIPDWRD